MSPQARPARRTSWNPHLLLCASVALLAAPLAASSLAPWVPDRGDGTYANPILSADYSDPDVVRVGDDFYLVSSSFHEVPGLPILHSRDLVSWTIVGHAAERLPSPAYDTPQHGNGVWAPSLRHHDGRFWVFFGDPDLGIFVTRARDPRGPWEPLHLVVRGRGLIDPCPLWDDDGQLYLVNAWAKSRAGFNGILTVRRLSRDGRSALDDGVTVFDGGNRHPTIEGPKLYRKGGWVYLFAPAGGVKHGWQTVLRARNVLGPYEDRIVLDQGTTDVNGPHQGALVDTPDGASWFVHFQDRGPYGRVTHLQPVTWKDGWPVIGDDPDGDGKGQPVLVHRKPAVRTAPAASAPLAPQTSDEFDGPALSMMWQWNANPSPRWLSLAARPGALRLHAQPRGASARASVFHQAEVLVTRAPAERFTATVLVDVRGSAPGAASGLAVLGRDTTWVGVQRTAAGWEVVHAVGRGVDTNGRDEVVARRPSPSGRMHLRVTVSRGARLRFSASADGVAFEPVGEDVKAREGVWVGARLGLFTLPVEAPGAADFTDVDWFRVERAEARDTGHVDAVVAQDGSGGFTTIQAALDSLPEAAQRTRVVLVRRGVYREKLFVTKSRLAIVGEDRDGTRVEYAQLRREWRKAHPDDWGAAVVNVGDDVSDLVLANLTVHNDYGRRHGGETDHQFAVRSGGRSTRIVLLHASLIADGGDTVSLWNAETGLSYHASCAFEGGVDYVCPRGSCYVTNSRFFGHSLTASLWHDGSKDRDHRFVVRSSRFDGVPGFPLGRNNRDGQFYLLDDIFSASMADRPVYQPSAPETYRWEPRAYFHTCHGEDGDRSWFADNLGASDFAPTSAEITPEWTFCGQWDPEGTMPAVLPFAAVPRPHDGARDVPIAGAELRFVPAREAAAHELFFGTTEDPLLVARPAATAFETGPLAASTTYFWRVDALTPDGRVPGGTWRFTTAAQPVRVTLAGDSTVTDEQGWGRGFASRLGEGITCVNLARGGRSSRSYVAEGHWEKVLAARPDVVLIQFGHNDGPGKGPERESDPRTAFREHLARMVDEARAAGIAPVLVTPLTRRALDEAGCVRSDLGPWAEATLAVGSERRVPVIDLHERSLALLHGMSPDEIAALGGVKPDGTPDRTHLSPAGGALFGAVVAEELARAVPRLAPGLRPSPAGATLREAK